MASGKTIRELLVSLGVKADTKSIKKFDKAIDSAKDGMNQALAASKRFSNGASKSFKRFSDSARRGLAKADESFSAFEKSLKKNEDNMKRFSKAAAGLTAGVAIMMGGMLLVASSTAKVGDSIGKAAARVGVTAEEFQVLSFAAGEAGVSVSQLEDTLKTQSIAMANASKGATGQVNALRAVGLSFKEAKKLSQFDLFKRIADGLLKIDDKAKRTSATVALFGEVGTKLGPLLKSGAAGIDAAALSAKKLQLIMSDEAIKTTEDYTDSMGRLTSGISAFKDRVGLLIIKALLPLIDGINLFVEQNQPLIKQLEKLTPLLLGVIVAISAMASIGIVIASIGFFVSALSALATAATAAAGAVGMTLLPFLGVLATGFTAVLVTVAAFSAGLAIVGLAFEDIWVTMNGGDSLISRFIDKFKKSDGIIGSVARTTGILVDGLVSLWDLTKSVSKIFVDLSTIFVNLGIEGLNILLESTINILKDMFGIDMSPFTSGFKLVEDSVSNMMLGLKNIASYTKNLSGITGGLSEKVSQSGVSGLTGAIPVPNVTNSLNQTVTNQITGANPVAIGAEVSLAMESQYRLALASFKGGMK